MSSSHFYQSSNSNPTLDEQRWIAHIRRLLDDEDLDQDSDTPISIFVVPRTLLLTSLESYVPQVVALGPYHHCRSELQEMERYKLSAAKRFQRHLQGPKFHNLVDHLNKYEPQFRACDQKYLNFNDETLTWMMAVDSCFLLEFLQVFTVKEDRRSIRNDKTGQTSGCRDAIVRDIVKLENQIPLFAVRKIQEFLSGSQDEADEQIYATMIVFFEEVLPLKMIQELSGIHQITKSAHLLEFLYNLIVPNFQGSCELRTEAEEEEGRNKGEKMNFWKIIYRRVTGPFSLMKRLLISKPVKSILTLPWKIISILPGVILIKQVGYLCFSEEKEEEEKKKPENEAHEINIHPLMEEISIPSVTQLSNAGVQFSITNSGISGINFDSNNVVLYLPSIVLDLNAEVIMRNLVAYEACNESGPLIFTRYTELMNGIIDSEEDAKIMREKGIVLNHLKSDEDVASLWNGMSKSIRLTKVPLLDKVIEDVNNYYNGSWKVRIGKLFKSRVFGSWQSMTFFAAILLLFFMTLQTFCSLFGCVRLFSHPTRMK
ncbi:hypothetical protein ACS0TY_021223 [Phlomoides rotata]